MSVTLSGEPLRELQEIAAKLRRTNGTATAIVKRLIADTEAASRRLERLEQTRG